MALKDPVGPLLAMAHLDHLLATGEKPAAFEKEAKKLGLQPATNDRLATPEGAILDTVKQIASADEVARLAERSRDPGILYYTAVAYMMGMDREHRSYVGKAADKLNQLRRWAPDHAEVLLKALEGFPTCPSCKDARKIACFACGGRGKRSFSCPECGGKGTIEWDPKSEKTEKRKELDGKLGLSDTRSYCPSCLGRLQLNKWNHQTKDCDFCGTAGSVECQRCKWQVPSFAAIAKMEDCANCDKTGLMFANVLVPCTFCKGVGGFVIPSAKREATVGPKE
jgi:hypothetical protein